MIKNGVVRSFVEEQVLVEIVDEDKLGSSSCKPSSCSTCESCGNKKYVLAELPDSIGKEDIHPGIWVEVFSDNIKYSIAVTITFILPIIMLLFGIWLGTRVGMKNEIMSLILGGILFAFSLIFAYIFDKSFKAKVKITKVIERND